MDMQSDSPEPSFLTMNEIIPNLWLGDLISALDATTLRAKGVRSIVSVMRGRVNVHETFIRRQVPVDDMEEEDILIHIGPCVHFISKELAKGHGVLVHCQAGVSRSATIVTAYLMHISSSSFASTSTFASISGPLITESALALVRAKRPIADPNPGFMKQLELFYSAGCPVASSAPAHNPTTTAAPTSSKRPDLAPVVFSGDSESVSIRQYKDALMKSKSVRAWYLKRNAHWMGRGPPGQFEGQEVGDGLNWTVYPSAFDDIESAIHEGDGHSAVVEESSFASTSRSSVILPAARLGLEAPSEHLAPSTDALQPQAYHNPPAKPQLRRKRVLRCKMCRYIVAEREDILEHGSPTGVDESTEVEGLLCISKCSGYFIEPPKWFNPSPSSVSGKLPCPNPRRCSAKLGNFDWAGMKCGCGGWAVPGFVLGRGKVDEISVPVGR